MNRRNVYLLLFLLGIIIPYWQFVPWVLEYGLNLRLFVDQLFANRISAFFGMDVFVSAVVVFTFAHFERQRLGLRRSLPLLAVLVFGVSAGLPLLLYLRESSTVTD